MEDFNQNFNQQDQFQKPLKEKKVYLLHLDGARICILAALLIGIVTVTFLIGMKFTESENQDNALLSKNDMLLQTPKNEGQKEIDDLFDKAEQEQSKTLESEASNTNLLLPEQNTDKTAASQEKTDDATQTAAADKTPDILNSHNVKQIIPAVKDAPRKVSKSSSKSKKHTANRTKPSSKKVASRKKASKKVVAVSSGVRSARKKIPVYSAPKRSGYFIQVASYDKSFKAQKEANRLKSMHFDAYIDNALVDGKQYYRVRIGPLASKQHALRMLNNMQDNPRYRASYMVYE
jgi:cell division protein FtsN